MLILKRSVGEMLNEMMLKEVRSYYDYIVYYKDERLYHKLLDLMKSIDLPITLIATYPEKNMVSVAYEVSLDTIQDFLHFVDRVVKELSTPKSTKK